MKTDNLIKLTVALLVAFGSVRPLLAQNVDALFGRFESRFSLLDSIIHHPEKTSVADDVNLPTADLAAATTDLGYVDSIIDNSVRARISAERSVTGLSINGQIYGRLDEGFGLDEDDALSRYKSKIQADIRWNIFGSALINRKGKANELSNSEK